MATPIFSSFTSVFGQNPQQAAFDFVLSNSGPIQIYGVDWEGGGLITATLLTGSSQLITLSCSDLPVAAACDFYEGADGTPTFTINLRVTVSSSTPTGPTTFTVTGIGGGVTRTMTLQLIVYPFVGAMSSIIINASPFANVAFVLPDYVGPYHTPLPKFGGVKAAALSDFSAAGYLLGLLSNPQNQILDTSIPTETHRCIYPCAYGAYVVVGGPEVNELVYYFEQNYTDLTPVYYLWDGVRNNFVIRATGQRYTVPVGNTAAGDDLFLVEAFLHTEHCCLPPSSVFVLYGFSWQGTLAAGEFFASYIYPQISEFQNSWYIYRWQDAVSGQGQNSFPDPYDTYTLIATSGATPNLEMITQTTASASYPGFSGIYSHVLQAASGQVDFILPDYYGPYHSPARKCRGVFPAALSDYSVGGYILSASASFQNEYLDTGSSVSTETSNCGQYLGSASTIVTVAGPRVNTVVHYYEQVSGTTPVYFLWDGAKNNFVVRATGQRYAAPVGNTIAGDDLFLLETFVDAQGRWVYMIYGFSWQGTMAAGTFVSTYARFHLSEFTNGWYIYEWKDASQPVPGYPGYTSSINSFPDSWDQFNQLATG